jgi:hypothetical protein
MLGNTHLIIPDQHAHPDFSNERADWLGKLIADIKPDIVINIGDAADMSSLNLYEKGKASFHGKNYEKDINAHLDFQERLWAPMKKSKRKLPYRVVLEGNHEYRVKRAISLDPQLEGERFGLSFKDFDFNHYYNEVIEYVGDTPGLFSADGVTYGHYMISGIMGRAIGGENHAASLLTKNFISCTVGHSHTVDWAVKTTALGQKIMGCVCGVYQDYESPWAGHRNDLWWSGVVVKRDVRKGVYSPEFISIDKIREEYK